MPRRWANAKTGAFCPCVSAWSGRLNIALVLKQTVENVNGFPDAARNEMAEQRNVAICDVVIPDAAVAAIADVILGQQILFVQIPLRTVG
jgi:hypothetical protein